MRADLVSALPLWYSSVCDYVHVNFVCACAFVSARDWRTCLTRFFNTAQEVITAKDLVSQTDVRLMASVYFKNSVNRYWRNRRDSRLVISLSSWAFWFYCRTLGWKLFVLCSLLLHHPLLTSPWDLYDVCLCWMWRKWCVQWIAFSCPLLKRQGFNHLGFWWHHGMTMILSRSGYRELRNQMQLLKSISSSSYLN